MLIVGTPEPCACGCGQPITGRGAYASGACRTRDWKRRAGYGDPRRSRASRNAKFKPSGPQYSRRKAREAIELRAIRLGLTRYERTQLLAALDETLSVKQAARVHARTRDQEAA